MPASLTGCSRLAMSFLSGGERGEQSLCEVQGVHTFFMFFARHRRRRVKKKAVGVSSAPTGKLRSQRAPDIPGRELIGSDEGGGKNKNKSTTPGPGPDDDDNDEGN
jgi:hypothetical protein